MSESEAMRNYKNKISEEITKRKFLQLESMSLSDLLIEYNKIKDEIPSEPKIIHTVDTIQVEPDDYRFFQAYALAGLIFGFIGMLLGLMLALELL